MALKMTTVAEAATGRPRPAAPVPPKDWPGLWWSLRHIRDLGNPIALWPEESYQAGIIVRRFRGRTAVVVNQPEAVRHVLLTNSSNYRKTRDAVALLAPVMGNGLLTSDGEDWRRQRYTALPAFHRKSILGFVPVMSRATAETLARWGAMGDGATIDVSREMSRLTLTIFCRTMFSDDHGDDIDSINATYTRWLQSVDSRALITGATRRIMGLPAGWAAALAALVDQFKVKPLDGYADGFVARRRARGPLPDDLLSLLIRAQQAGDGSDPMVQDLRDQILAFLLAGHETTARALTWTCYLIDLHPWCEERLCAEVDSILAGRAPTADDISRLTYTRMVIEESLRLYPPAQIMNREAVDDDEIGGIAIPKAANVFVSPWLIHRNRTLWRDADYFDPERFAPGRAAGRHGFAYLPFGAGPRRCIGSGFATTEAVIILAMVVQRFRLRLKRGHRVEPLAQISLRPRHGMPMRLERR